MSQRTLEQCSLWHLAAFFCVTGTDLSEIVRAVLPLSLRRFRALCEELLPQSRPEALRRVQQLTGPGTEFEAAVLFPTSYMDFEDAFEETLPLDIVSALRDAWKLAAASSASTPLSAQYLMEGLDVWLQQRDPAENDRFVFACGVSPAALAQGKAVHPLAALDFVLDVIFPEGSVVWPRAAAVPAAAAGAVTPAAPAKQVSDWLVGVLRANGMNSSLPPPCSEWIQRAVPTPVSKLPDPDACGDSAAASPEPEAACPVPPVAPPAVVVEASPIPAAGASPSTPCSAASRPSLPQRAGNSSRAGRAAQRDDGGEDGNESAPEEEFLLTEDNLEHLMSTSPQSVPKVVLHARRKPLTHPSITPFELEQHYTLPELRDAVLTIVRAYREAPSPNDKELAASLDRIDQFVWRGKKQSIVASLFEVLPNLRRLQHALTSRVAAIDVDALSSSESRTGSVSRAIVLSENGSVEAATRDGTKRDASRSSPGASESCVAQIAALLSQAASGSTAHKSLVRELTEQFTRSQLDEYLRVVGNASQSEVSSLRTKSECAKRIIADAVGRSTDSCASPASFCSGR